MHALWDPQAVESKRLIAPLSSTLDLDRGGSWIAGLNAIDTGDDRLGGVVIRPELLNVTLGWWPLAQVIAIKDVAQARREASQLRMS